MQSLSPRLDRTILAAARRLAWRASADGPDTFEALDSHYQRTGEVLVSSGFSARSIYGRPFVNWALRAVHDADHLRWRCPFTEHGELACATEATLRLVRRGPDRDLLRADAVGQVEHYFAFGSFPLDQRAFVVDYLTHGGLTRSFA